MRVSPTKKTLITLLIASIAAIAGYVLMINFVFQKEKAAEGFSEEIVYETDRESRFRSLERLITDLEEGRNLVNKQFAGNKERDIVEYITLLESLPKYADVELNIVNVISDSVEEGIGEFLKVPISVIGRGMDIVEFIQLVESLPITTTIEEIKIGIGIDGVWNVSITLHALVSD